MGTEDSYGTFKEERPPDVLGSAIPVDMGGQEPRGCRMVYRGQDMDDYICDALLACGVRPDLNGYRYLEVGLKLCLNDPEIVRNPTSLLYPVIAERCGASAHGVERGIHSAVLSAFKGGKTSCLSRVIPDREGADPKAAGVPNGWFIAALLNCISRKAL